MLLRASTFVSCASSSFFPEPTVWSVDDGSEARMGDIRAENGIERQTSRSAKPCVLVTGFGPFGEHSINASWEAVQQLKTINDLTEQVDLIIHEIPVAYSAVTTIVPELWKKYDPDLVIHCGVSSLLAWKSAIQIERHAHSHGYHRPDVECQIPEGGRYCSDEEERCLSTNVCVDKCHTWTTNSARSYTNYCNVPVCQLSTDAGRYLCEFIYYTSLRINPNATLFIHVPPLYKPFSAHDIAMAIKTVILKVVLPETAEERMQSEKLMTEIGGSVFQSIDEAVDQTDLDLVRF
ncbi:hypothetical protein RvY_13338 [Ramazzottius varieornatus]|uniref:Pyroglutamyl-peptidase I n=1 Tax=Ramazzottius varieornatus TaxID=947166 RepID=A0A1D1VMH9_RAMVA|nr:hypothetical protein RvY_13338 [Ramazzottius varieornatus]